MATIQPVEIQVDGNPVPAYLSVPRGGENHPGIIVLCEIFGVNQNIRNVCTRLADPINYIISILPLLQEL